MINSNAPRSSKASSETAMSKGEAKQHRETAPKMSFSSATRHGLAAERAKPPSASYPTPPCNQAPTAEIDYRRFTKFLEYDDSFLTPWWYNSPRGNQEPAPELPFLKATRDDELPGDRLRQLALSYPATPCNQEPTAEIDYRRLTKFLDNKSFLMPSLSETEREVSTVVHTHILNTCFKEILAPKNIEKEETKRS